MLLIYGAYFKYIAIKQVSPAGGGWGWLAKK